jgi:betaine-homocysteine S-methyltransferase
MAEALGKKPPASRYSPDMSKHYAFGTDSRLRKENQSFAKNMTE